MRVILYVSALCFCILWQPALFAADPVFTAIEFQMDHAIEGDVIVARLSDRGPEQLLVQGKMSGGKVGDDSQPFFTMLSPLALSPLALSPLAPQASRNLTSDPSSNMVAGWQSAHSQRIDLPEDAIFFDIISQGEGRLERLAILTHEAIYLIDPENSTFQQRLPASSIYRYGGNPDFARLDFARDVNGDGLDDLVIADFGAYHVFLQTRDGFADSFDLPFQSEMRIGSLQSDEAVSPRYASFPIYSFDTNLDGKNDIVFLKSRDFISFEQQDDGKFTSTPKYYPIPIDVVGNSWAEERAAENARANGSNFSEARITLAEDFDNDGLVDIFTAHETANGTFDRTAKHSIHYGRRGAAGLYFESDADTSIAIDGIIPFSILKDITGDGMRDGMYASAEFGIGKLIGILINKSTRFDLSFFAMNKDRQFPQKANLVKKLSVDFDFSSGDVAIPVFMTADVDGDKHADLILDHDRRALDVFKGVEGDRLFEKRGETFPVALPKDGQLVKASDVDGDGRFDLLIRFDPNGQDGEENKRRLILLLAKG